MEMEQTNTHTYCVLDIETAGGDLDRVPHGFRLLLVGLKCRVRHLFYNADHQHLQVVADFLDSFNGTLVTFNGRRFDIPILNQHLLHLLGRSVEVRYHYDILEQINLAAGYRISLAELALLNLGVTKAGWDHRTNAQTWLENPNLLRAHNKEDLDLTAAIYELIVRGEPIRLGRLRLVLRRPERDSR